jgi:5-formyltetrahydrofolate cyclo-ligase
MTAGRSHLGAAERSRACGLAASRLAALPEMSAAIRAHAVVAGFVSTRDEIDPAPVLADARRQGARVAYPRIGTGSPRMRFHVAAPEQLRPGRFGIWEPEATCPEVAAPDVALMIIPGLAFDAAGHRLGFGGGYYDEWLLAAGVARAGTHAVGLAFDFQVVDACPAGDGDARLDEIVTDRRTIICSPPPDRAGAPAPEGS